MLKARRYIAEMRVLYLQNILLPRSPRAAYTHLRIF